MNPKVGHIEFANCLPLYYGLDKNGILIDIDLIKAKPTELAGMLMTAHLDLAPIPSIEYGRNYEKLTLLPGISISSDSEVKSILLVSKEPVENLTGKKVALTSASATSQVLLKIILKEKYNVTPVYFESSNNPEVMLTQATGALIIGDEALKLSREHMGLYVLDLGKEWKEMTGNKMVYAVWALRDDFIKSNPVKAKTMDKAIENSIKFSKKCLSNVAEYGSSLTGLSVKFLKDYFDSLKFDFDESYREGMMLFYEKANKYGYLNEIPKLKFISRSQSNHHKTNTAKPVLINIRHKDYREIIDEVYAGKRITSDEAVALFNEADFLSLGKAALHVRQNKHQTTKITFVIDRNINYTNICRTKCKFCAFYRAAGDNDSYVLNAEEVIEKVEEAIQMNGTQIMLQGGLNPDLSLDYYVEILSMLKERFGSKIQIHSFSPPEISYLAQNNGLTIEEVLVRLRGAGLDSIPGGGAEMLVDTVRRKLSPKKIMSRQWLDVMEEAHKLGMKTTATMMFGSVESYVDRVKHLEEIRDLQDKYGGFRAFIPWTFQSGNTELGGRQTSAIDYLKTLAISRIYLDNVDNIQASWVTQGSKIAQLALIYGANDMGSTMIEENVVKATGVDYRLSKEEIIRMIEDAGYSAAQRTTDYEIIKEF